MEFTVRRAAVSDAADILGLHKAFGFSEIGVYHNVGYKLGRWLDVMWM